MVLRKQLALARSFGVECEEISPARAGELFAPLRTDDLAGAIWIPGDGKANPADLTMSLAKGARNRGVRIVEGAEVVAVRSAAGATGPQVTGLRVRHQGDEVEIACEIVVNCAGQWARQLGALAGVNVPLWSAEHFYIVTDRIDGVHPMLPVLRDPDGYIYYKEEVGGLLMGGFEPKAKPWQVDPIPSTFRFELLDEDWDQFEPLMTAAIQRTPCLETAQVKMLLNGPESFTPDGNFILGEAPELRRFFVAAGFNSAGIANSGGAGKLIAEWIVAGSPQSDLADVDIRRFGAHTANKKALAERTGETLGLHYAMRWPRQELETARPLRTSPLHDLLLAGRDLRRQERLGARQLLPRRRCSGDPSALPAHARQAGMARRHGARAAGDPAGGRALRPDVVRQAPAAGPRRARGAAAAVRQRDGRRPGPHGLHADAEPARRLRERRHRDPPRRRPLPGRHRLGAGAARPRLDRAPHRRRRSGGAGRRQRHDRRALADGTECAHPARPCRRERHLRRARPRAAEVLDHARDRPRPRARSRRADELRRRPGLRALRADRDGAPRLPLAARRGRRSRSRRRRLLRARRPAHRGRPARLGRRARPRRDAVRGRVDVRGQARQGRRLHRQGGARSPGARSHSPRSW